MQVFEPKDQTPAKLLDFYRAQRLRDERHIEQLQSEIAELSKAHVEALARIAEYQEQAARREMIRMTSDFKLDLYAN